MSRWERTVLMCAKCQKRSGRDLAKQVRREIGVACGRKASIGIVGTKCLGICPKRGVVVLDAATPGTWRIVTQEASAADVVAVLGLPTTR